MARAFLFAGLGWAGWGLALQGIAKDERLDGLGEHVGE